MVVLTAEVEKINSAMSSVTEYLTQLIKENMEQRTKGYLEQTSGKKMGLDVKRYKRMNAKRSFLSHLFLLVSNEIKWRPLYHLGNSPENSSIFSNMISSDFQKRS